MDIRQLDANPEGSSEGTKSVLREAMDITNTDVFVCWKVTNPEEEMKDMVAHWDEFIVLSAAGKPLGTAREYFLTK